MVLTWVIQHLHQLDHIRMVEFLENGDLLVHPLQRAFGLRWALRIRAGPSRRRSSWETSLPHQTLLGQDLHRVVGVVVFIVGQFDNSIRPLSNLVFQLVLVQLHAVLQISDGNSVRLNCGSTR
uniref:Calcium/calmodulin dependent protein kinase kinase 2 n=1 Tax=Tachysurus fulvidraco TaxID=1234273 RepID=A0A3T0TUP0_TACFU|nr:calcium/calmodulin dependent protein kinase kinase 2 [Tachysurus fulvidraco]